MRAHSTRSTPIPITLISNYQSACGTCLTRTLSPLHSQGRGQGESFVHLAISAADPLTLILSLFEGERRIRQARTFIRDTSPSRRAFPSRRFRVQPTRPVKRSRDRY